MYVKLFKISKSDLKMSKNAIEKALQNFSEKNCPRS